MTKEITEKKTAAHIKADVKLMFGDKFKGLTSSGRWFTLDLKSPITQTEIDLLKDFVIDFSSDRTFDRQFSSIGDCYKKHGSETYVYLFKIGMKKK